MIGGDWTRLDIKAVTWRPWKDASTVLWFGPKITRWTGLPVWASKPGARSVRSDC